jgi:hypothetical protein
MSARDLIHQALADGVRLSLSDAGKLRYTGPEDAVVRWLPAIRDSKPAIIAALSPTPDTPARLWLLHYPDQNPREVFRFPPATHAEILADNPEAVAAEPMTDQVVDLGEGDVDTVVAQDDRHRCADCQHLTHGVCRVAAPGAEVSAVKGYRPISTMLVRCPGFAARGGKP